jgi:hypothetical protein
MPTARPSFQIYRSAAAVLLLRTDVGHFAPAGAAAVTLIAIHDMWINGSTLT